MCGCSGHFRGVLVRGRRCCRRWYFAELPLESMINENNPVVIVPPAQSFGYNLSDNAKANEEHSMILVFEAI